jgi:glucokinase
MEMFVDAYGAAAGNLALTALALGGLYVGGGIAPRILPLLQREDRFLRAFRAKGRLTELLSEVPVHVVLEPRAALLGAARRATLAD